MNRIERKKCYKNLLDRGSELRLIADDSNAVTIIDHVTKVINESNMLNSQANLRDHVNNTTEVVMDAQVMKMGHELLGSVINKIGCSEFSDEEYSAAILKKVFADNESMNWDALADISVKVVKTTKFSPCLLGSFKHDPVAIVKIPKERQKRKTTQSQLLRPEVVSKFEKKDKGAQKLNLALSEILKIYKGNNQQPIPYYKLIVDPQSIMKTIDNSFQVAFLVSNGSIAMETDDSGLPAVRPISKDKSNPLSGVPVQAAANITAKICKSMIKRYKIREPLLKLPDQDCSTSTVKKD